MMMKEELSAAGGAKTRGQSAVRLSAYRTAPFYSLQPFSPSSNPVGPSKLRDLRTELPRRVFTKICFGDFEMRSRLYRLHRGNPRRKSLAHDAVA
jgi:hypothetical protein